MSTETSMLITNNTNPIIPNNEVIKDNSSFFNEKEGSPIGYNNAGHHPIAVEMFSIMALFRNITAIMGRFEQFARDIAMKLSQSFSQEDFAQMMAAFDKKIESINDMYNINITAAWGQMGVSVLAAGLGGVAALSKMGAIGASVTSELANSVGNKSVDLYAITPRTDAQIKESTADNQSQQVRFFSEIWEKAEQWKAQMSQMFEETNKISVQVFRDLTQSFSTLF